MTILQSIGDYIGPQPEFRGYDIYYSTGQITANTEFPCICISIGYADDNSEKGAIDYNCRDFYRNIGIKYYTKTKEPGEVENELMDFDETLINALSKVYPANLNEHLVNISYVGSQPTQLIYTQPFRQNFKAEVMASIVTVNYELQYLIEGE